MKLVSQVLRNSPKIKIDYAKRIVFYVEKYSKIYDIDPKLMLAVFRQESNYSLGAVNKKTKDFSIGQINIKNVRHFKMDQKRLHTDLEYAIERSFFIMSQFKGSGKHWWARYNSSKPTAKHAYIQAVGRWL
jgi:hypothetical protein